METTLKLNLDFQNHTKHVQPKWHRVILLSVLGYEAAGCLVGGSFLAVRPDGSLMDMPVSIMNGAFRDFLIPGIILFGLGIFNTIAFFTVLRRNRYDWFMAGLAMGGLLIWFWVEIAILQHLHWLHAMWGLPVIAGGLASITLFPSWKTIMHKAMLYCGILSSLLYVAINIIVPLLWPSYSCFSLTVSELSAIGAPTRIVWIVLCVPYTLLIIVFARGILKSASNNSRLHTAGVLLFAYGVVSLIWPFAPMHMRETLAAGGSTFSDTMHITLAAVTVILMMLAIGFGAAALGKPFRLYSIITMIVLMSFGVLTFIGSPNVAKNLPTPWLGVWERINIGVFLIWIIVLAAYLLKSERLEFSIKFVNRKIASAH